LNFCGHPDNRSKNFHSAKRWPDQKKPLSRRDLQNNYTNRMVRVSTPDKGNRMSLWWLSFSDDEFGFLGVVIIEAPTFLNALGLAIGLNVHPGGDCTGHEIETIDEIPDQFQNRLLDLKAIDRFETFLKQ
jgi:hypothetical protein